MGQLLCLDSENLTRPGRPLETFYMVQVCTGNQNGYAEWFFKIFDSETQTSIIVLKLPRWFQRAGTFEYLPFRAFSSMPKVEKPQRAGQIWPSVCFCAVRDLIVVIIFLNNWKNKRIIIFHDVEVIWNLNFSVGINCFIGSWPCPFTYVLAVDGCFCNCRVKWLQQRLSALPPQPKTFTL